MEKKISVVLLVQLGLGSIDEWHNLPVLSGHLEEVMSQKLLRGPALVNVHLKEDISFLVAEMPKRRMPMQPVSDIFHQLPKKRQLQVSAHFDPDRWQFSNHTKSLSSFRS